MSNKYEHLIVRDIQWLNSLPDHEGSVGGKGFPVLMNQGLVQEAKAWVCPTLVLATEESKKRIDAGEGPKATLHVHDADEMYLVLGEKDVFRIKVTLGEDTYEVSSPGAVYIPAGLPHSIECSKLTVGKYAGSCQVVLDEDYKTFPVSENSLKIKNTEHLIMRDITWVTHLPDHEGSVGGKGFPILVNSDLIPEAKAWVCPVLITGSEELQKKFDAGTGARANLHTHEEDEMYVVLGEKDAFTIKVQLGDENYEVNSPGAVYIPAGLPHSIAGSKVERGKFCGSCQIVLGKEYVTKPVLE